MLTTPVTYFIIGITILISYRAFNDLSLKAKFLMNPWSVAHRKEYSRVFTHALIHSGWMHLGFNMFVLYMFGTAVEAHFVGAGEIYPGEYGAPSKRFGHVLFATLYIGGIIAGSIPSMLKHRDNSHYNSLGASGAVYAVLIAYVFLFPTRKLGLIFLPGVAIWGIVMAILIFAYEHYMQRRGGTGIAHDAHLWGAGFGALFVCLIDLDNFPNFIEQISEGLSF